MKREIRLLTLTVRATMTLLSISGTLIVLGLFNESLNWDIFGPKIEAVLYGIFGSSIALACVGVAMTMVLGIQEIVQAFRALQCQRIPETGVLQETTARAYALCLFSGTLILVLIISSFALTNYGVLKHRSKVFHRLAAEQLSLFQPRFSQLLSPLAAPPRDNVPIDLYDLARTFDNLAFVSSITIYMRDPLDSAIMWEYTAPPNYRKKDGFSKFFVAKNLEKAMASAIGGNIAALDALNRNTDFIWYHLIRDDRNLPVAVLRIEGNSRENFREYALGS